VRPLELDRYGIPREYLIRLLRKGVLHRAGRGVYELAAASPTMHHSLVLVAKEVPQGIICLLSALRFHELTTQNPQEVWVGIPARARRPKISTTAHQVVRFSDSTYSAGVETHRIENVPVKVFSPAKTVADCFKYRNRIGLDVAMEALKDALRQRKATVDDLTYFAELGRVAKVMRPYVEASLWG